MTSIHRAELLDCAHALLLAAAAIAAAAIAAAAIAAGALAASPGPSASDEAAPFAHRTFVLTSYIAEDGSAAGPVARATLRFDAEVTGSTGCNDFHGPWTSDGTQLALGPLLYTARACTNVNTGQDMGVRAALAETAGYQDPDGQLQLLDASGNARLTYGSLEDRTWVPMFQGDAPTPSGLVTVAFLDGVVSGQAPCNQYSATYQVDSMTLSIGRIATTRSSCREIDIERHFLATLADARAWDILDGDLVLLDENGAALGQFAPAGTAE